jgi:hypothetical protein
VKNPKYFHLIADGKHRIKIIFQLEQDECSIVGQENLKIYIFEYNKKLFGAPALNNFSTIQYENTDIPQLS